MLSYLKLFVPTLIFVFAADMLWLGIIAKKHYFDAIGQLMRRVDNVMAPNWPAAFVVYIAITAGILIFALPKAEGDSFKAFMYGALYGAILYGVYDFTNLSILDKWPINITLIDFFWGTMLNGMACLFANSIRRFF